MGLFYFTFNETNQTISQKLKHMLSDQQILHYLNYGSIVIKPFRQANLGSNSYDVHLSKYLMAYLDPVLDAKKENLTEEVEIPEDGMALYPGILYLGSTVEYTETHEHVPFIEGKSSTGRLGISIHATAGKGDVGFCGHWTLEITVVHPIRVYAGMPIGQLIYFELGNKSTTPYDKKKSAKYNQQGPRPVPSMMWKNKF
jgi:dCTP deaminase